MRKQVIITAVVCAFLALLSGIKAQAQSAYSNAVMALNPVAYWPLQETNVPASYIATNLGTLGAVGNGYYNNWWSNNANALILTNTMIQTNGATGDGDGAIFVNNTSGQYVGFPRSNPGLTVTAPFTVEAWVNNGSVGQFGTIVSQGRIQEFGPAPAFTNTASGFWLGTANNSFIVSLWNQNGTAGQEMDIPSAAFAGVWTHLATTFDGSNLTLYVNGQIFQPLTNGNINVNPAGPGTSGYTVNAAGHFYEPNTQLPLLIGALDNNATRWIGGIDDVAIYHTALSQVQIQNHVSTQNNPAGPTSYKSTVLADNPFIYVRLDEPDMGTVLGQPNGTLIGAYTGGTVANNFGSVGAAANGAYLFGTVPGSAGPTNAGFGTLTNAVAINGINGAIDIGGGNLAANLPSFIPTTNQPTISVIGWFKANPADDKNRFQALLSRGNSGWRFALDNVGGTRFNAGTSGEPQFGAVLGAVTNGFFADDGLWHMEAGVINGTNVSMYIDGRLAATASNATPFSTNTAANGRDLLIGADPDNINPGGRSFAGSLTHVAYFTNALTAGQIAALYDTAVSDAGPYFVLQPLPFSTSPGYNATFICSAGGGASLGFQWYKGTPGSATALVNGGNVAGATTNVLVLSNVSPGDAGNYFVAATNNTGSTTSSVVAMTITAKPTYAYATAVLAQNPIGYWPLDETNQPPSPFIATNIGTLGSSLNGIYNTWWRNNNNVPFLTHNQISVPGATGDGDKAAFFGLAGGFVLFPHSSPNSIIQAPFTIELWAEPTNTPGTVGLVTQGKLANAGGTAFKGFWLGVTGSTVVFQLYNTNGTTAQEIDALGVIAPGVFTHIAATFDGTTATLYVNGNSAFAGDPLVLTPNAAGQRYVPDEFDPLLIGCNSEFNSGLFPGFIDEVAIYPTALSAGQVSAHIAAQNNPAGPTSYRSAVLANSPSIYLRLDDTMPAPTIAGSLNALPAATNYGSLGGNILGALNGAYQPGTIPGIPGPTGTGFGTTSRGVAIGGWGAAVDIGHGLLRNIIGTGLDRTGANPMTVVAWFKGPADSQPRFQNILGHSDTGWRMAMGNEGKPHFNPGGGGEIIGSTVTWNNDGNWHMLVGVSTGTSNLMYVDGNLNTLVANAAANAGDPRDIILGGDPNYTTPQSRLFEGSISQVAFYSNALSGAQISAIYNAGQVLPFVDLLQTSSVNNAGTVVTNIAVLAGGSTPLTYQWFKGNPPSGTLLGTQTSTNLVFNPIQGTDAGNYYAVVSNAVGTATSGVVSITVLTAPTITSQTPVGGTYTMFAGAQSTFSVSASGAVPLAYQWFSGATVITNATNSSFTFNIISGTYTCRVTNFLGQVTSSPVTVNALSAPTNPYPTTIIADKPIAYYRLDETGGNGSVANDYVGGNNGLYTNVVQGVTPGYVNGVSDTDAAATFGTIQTSNSYVGGIPLDFSTPNHGSNTVVSVEAWVQDSVPTTDAGIITKGWGGAAAPVGEQINLDEGSTSATHGFRFFARDTTSAGYRVNSAIVPDGSTWHHLVGEIDETNGAVLRLYVDAQLQGTIAIAPGTQLLPSAIPLTIGSRLAGPNSTAYDNQSIGTIDEVAIYNFALSPTQVTNHYLAAGIAPFVTSQPPASDTVNEGANISISITSSGTAPLFYQWEYNGGLLLTNQTNATMTLTNVTSGEAGFYQCIVSNAYGTTTSAADTLNVVAGPPVIFSQPSPASLTVYAGIPVTYTVGAGGTAPITYQWLINGTPISGATNSSYIAVITSVGGPTNYSVVVSNSVNTVTSSTVQLSTVAAPSNFYAQTVLADAPIAYWRLNEGNSNAPTTAGTGQAAFDYVGGHNGVYTNATVGNPGIGATGYSFLDTDTAAVFGSAGAINYVGLISNIDFSTQVNPEFSVEVWVNQSAVPSDNGIVSLGTGGGGEQFDIDGNGGGRFITRTTGGIRHEAIGNGSLLGAWHYLVGVVDSASSTVTFYVDGTPFSLATTGDGAITPGMQMVTASGQFVSIGARQGGAATGYNFPFVGTVDEVAIYDYALSSNKVAAHFSAATTSPTVTLHETRVGSNVVLTWSPVIGTLQSSTNAASGYADISPAPTSPYTNAITTTNTYFRVKVH